MSSVSHVLQQANLTVHGVGKRIAVKAGQFLTYRVSGTFVATLALERSTDGGKSWEATGITATAAAISTFLVPEDAMYRWRMTARTSGSATCVLEDLPGDYETRVINVGARRGATAGWQASGTSNVGLMATLAASSAAGAKLVVPVPHLKVGERILGFHLIGQVESAGNSVTLDADLRSVTAVAADVSDASVAAMTQVSVVADTALGKANAFKHGLSEVVLDGVTYYFLLSARTFGSTDIALQGIAILVAPKQ